MRHQVVIGLEAEEETGRPAEVAGQAKVRVGRDRARADDDFVDAARRNAQLVRERGLAERQRLEEILKKNLSRRRIGQKFGISDNRQFGHRTALLPAK